MMLCLEIFHYRLRIRLNSYWRASQLRTRRLKHLQEKRDEYVIDDEKFAQLVKELEKSLRVDFFNRLNICYRSDDHLYIQPLSEIKKAAEIGTITAETTMFDNSIQTFGNWLEGWEKPDNLIPFYPHECSRISSKATFRGSWCRRA